LRKNVRTLAVKVKTAIYAKNYAKNAKGMVSFVEPVVNLVVEKLKPQFTKRIRFLVLLRKYCCGELKIGFDNQSHPGITGGIKIGCNDTQ
jgi:hypothetical protein